MPIICLMVRENHKMVREKSGNFVRAHGWTPCHSTKTLPEPVLTFRYSEVHLKNSFTVNAHVDML